MTSDSAPRPGARSPAAGPLACPKYPGGGMGGMTRLKGMGMFMAATWLGPALIIPSWSWVWKYMFEGRPVRQGEWQVLHCVQVSLLPTFSQLLCLQWDAYPILSLLCLQFLGCPHGKNCLLQILTINPLLNLLGMVPGKPPFSVGDSDTTIGT